MTREESRSRLGEITLSERGGAHDGGALIDAALEDGLCCPHCGSRHFRTIQRGCLWQDFNGEPGPGENRWSIDEPIRETNETVSLSCAAKGCRKLLWGEVP